ncbi:DNA polymerase iii subunits gamma and tau [Fusarium longipes]|uniref:DNA polymerase iii subunits gamma and tau n=1 Tax=Fusarium longipes TaxID=694270 RepID=A0A395SZR6_9HYPO|nr:DNA polymerase iii subunits gamma and tau [Fusarium longipes]
MFAAQQHPYERKRGREEEELAANGMSFGEHRNKRLQCLPLRASPRTAQQWQPDSSMQPPSMACHDQFQQNNFSQYPSNTPQNNGYSDMDMMRTNQLEQHQGSDRFSMMQLEDDNSNGRMPTPIQPNFAAQVRGQQAMTASPNGVVNMGHQNTGLNDDQSVPRTMAGGWQAVQNERRLPSPISEDDDSMACQPITPITVNFDSSVHGNMSPGIQHPNVRVEPSPPHDVEHHMVDAEPLCSSQTAEGEGDPTTPSPRRGHIRSRHTVNNWTWQPGMKKSFSIGYRSDCDKCRDKVPGHFNHIIVS